MRPVALVLLASAIVAAQTSSPQVPLRDAVRIREFYRLAAEIQDQIWPNWSATATPLLLVTPETEFLTHIAGPPEGFKKVSEEFYARPRQFSASFLATFPAFGPPSVIVIGQAENTEAKTSTPWLFVVMHEHFHQLQDAQPGIQQATDELGLSRGDKTGMWMLNYPFPYENPELGRSFGRLRDVLLAALEEGNKEKFSVLSRRYKEERAKFFSSLAPDDRKYLSFQLWKEGIARYTQIKCAEAAAGYRPTPEYSALPDFEDFVHYAQRARADTLDELKQADLAQWKRVVVYSFGASEGLLLDRLHPNWKKNYFKHLFTLDPDLVR